MVTEFLKIILETVLMVSSVCCWATGRNFNSSWTQGTVSVQCSLVLSPSEFGNSCCCLKKLLSVEQGDLVEYVNYLCLKYIGNIFLN